MPAETKVSGTAAPPYGMFIFSLICFTVLAASGIFLLASATAEGFPNAFSERSFSFVGLVFIAIWAKTSWSDILRVEPETDLTFRQKHRSFGLKAGSVVAVAFLGAGGFGAYQGLQKANLNSLIEQANALGLKTAPVKQRFIQIVRRDTPTVPEYLQRCTELEATLNDYEPALQQMDTLTGQIEQELKGDRAGTATITTMRTILQKDLEGAGIYRKEIAYAKQLAALPAPDNFQFFNANIQPVLDEEARIARDEIEIVKTAKARGVKLPEQIYKELGIK